MLFMCTLIFPLQNVRGLTRETLVAITADIETRLWPSKFLSSQGLPPEHPRSSTTDDVECFFSILRDTVGKNFTLKQVSFCCVHFDWFTHGMHHLNYRCIMGGEKSV